MGTLCHHWHIGRSGMTDHQRLLEALDEIGVVLVPGRHSQREFTLGQLARAMRTTDRTLKRWIRGPHVDPIALLLLEAWAREKRHPSTQSPGWLNGREPIPS